MISKNQILALDASTTSTGYAYYDDNEELHYGIIAPPSKHQAERRILMIGEEIIKILDLNPSINTIAMEDIQRGEKKLNNRAAMVLSWLQGHITLSAFQRDPAFKMEYLGPSHWRSVVGIQGKAIRREEQKKIDIYIANKEYGIEVESDDIADALLILSAYIKEHSGFLRPV